MVNEMTRGRSLSAVKRSGRLMLLLVVFWGIFAISENPRKSANQLTESISAAQHQQLKKDEELSKSEFCTHIFAYIFT